MVLKWIQGKDLSQVHVEGDNKVVLEAVQYNKEENIRWEDQQHERMY